MDEFKVSVIIPVYNAEKYLENAIASAINLPQVGEIILVEDKSPDNALELCKILEKKYPKVQLYRHPNNENRGAGASRNLGIKKSKFSYIAFLDADDWYLENRFEIEEKKFKDGTVDGVYSAVGFYEEGKGLIKDKLTTLKKRLPPKELLYYLIIGHYGNFHTNGITVKKDLLEKSGLFNDLRLHQDTHLWYRLAFFGKLVPGIIDKSTSIRRTHPENRIANKNKNSRYLFSKSVYQDFRNYTNVDKKAMRLIIRKYINSKSNNKMDKVLNYLALIAKDPGILKKI